jgi:predicted PurR-regulated permease PerM
MTWTKLSVTGLVLAGVVIFCLTYQIWAAAFLGVLFAIGLNGPAALIRNYVHMPHWTAVVLVMLIVLAVLVGLGWLIGSPLNKQIEILSEKLPEAAQNALNWMEQRPWGRNLLRRAEDLSEKAQQQLLPEEDAVIEPPLDARDPNAPSAEMIKLKNEPDPDGERIELPGLGQVLQSVGGLLATTIRTGALLMVSLMVMLFLTFDPEMYQRGLLWLVPARHEAKARKTMQRLGTAMRWWLLGRLTSMAAIGVLTSTGLWLIGMPAPIALGTLAGILSFVPNFGPIVSALPGLLLAVVHGPWMLLGALAVYVVAQLIESNVIEPLVELYAVAVPPGLLIITQVIFAVLTGVWGMIVATPLLVVVIVLIQQLYIRGQLNKPIEVTGST